MEMNFHPLGSRLFFFVDPFYDFFSGSDSDSDCDSFRSFFLSNPRSRTSQTKKVKA